MGLLDYYRQFEAMSEEEVNQGLRAQAAERRRKALARVETLDLSQTTWPELAHPSIVTAITFIARRGLQRYPHLRGSQLHDELATRHGVDSGRLILGEEGKAFENAMANAVGVRGGILRDRSEVVPAAADLVERHGEPVTSGGRRVHMGVLEPGDDHPPGQVQRVDRGADPVAHLSLAADSHDAVTAHRDRTGPRSLGVAAVHVGSGDDEVCGLVHERAPWWLADQRFCGHNTDGTGKRYLCDICI